MFSIKQYVHTYYYSFSPFVAVTIAPTHIHPINATTILRKLFFASSLHSSSSSHVRNVRVVRQQHKTEAHSNSRHRRRHRHHHQQQQQQQQQKLIWLLTFIHSIACYLVRRR